MLSLRHTGQFWKSVAAVAYIFILAAEHMIYAEAEKTCADLLGYDFGPLMGEG